MGVSNVSRVLIVSIAMFILVSAVLISAIPTKDPIAPYGSLNDLGFTAYNLFDVGSSAGDPCVDTTDNPFSSITTTCGVGACASTGVTSCINGIIHDSCIEGTLSADDNCNGIDDDCDGTTDEHYQVAQTTCGIGACASRGDKLCVDGKEVDTCTAGSPTGSDTNCNGVDEDCDGTPDNHYISDTSCFKPGVCASGNVASSCTEGVETLCTTGISTGADDNCNGIDEDCDGTADNNYVPQATTCGVGACASTGSTSCVEGNVQDSCTAGQPGTEVCDNIDNNCDGSVDESLTRPTTCGLGACSSNTGFETCSAGVWGGDTCNPLAGATEETCDNIDNNCNGQVDEGLTRPASNQLGLCSSNTETCSAGDWIPSGDNYVPTTESCNGVDDDCNGLIDDITLACGQGDCTGTKTCLGAGGGWSACSTNKNNVGICTECDAEGNLAFAFSRNSDCAQYDLTAISSCTNDPDNNPKTLDTAAGFGSTCSGIGTCTQASYEFTHTCNKELCGAECESDTDCASKCDGNIFFSGGTCDTASTCACTYTQENCDSKDGWFDTELTQWVSTGQCTEKEQEQQEYRDYSCSAEGCTYIVTEHQWIDTTTVRNKADSTSCDDLQSCTTNDICTAGVCAGTAMDCSSNNIAAVATCTNTPDSNPFTFDSRAGFTSECIDGTCTQGTETITHTCDKIQCQAVCTIGETETQACGESNLGVCKMGTETRSCTDGCSWGDWGSCEGAVDPTGTDDNCNSIDENCDGMVDNNYVSVPTTCGVGACASTGTTSCVAGAVVDSCTAGTPAETDNNCNGIDDNCNGVADEGYVSLPTTCGVGECASTGTTSCVAGAVVDSCTAGTPALNDVTCDGKDNNCDGTIDEGYVSLPTTCGIGACASTGSTSCVDGAVKDSCTPGQPSTEICDNIDNNCDGTVDEGLTQPASNQEGLCSGNTETCSAGSWIADESNYQPTDEICDNKDNNCDGQVDEGLTQACGEGICTGTSTCYLGGMTSCSTSGNDAGICAKCDSAGSIIYDSTQNIDCSEGTLQEISSCTNSPDSNPLTFDSAPRVDSVCSGMGTCTEPTQAISHTCNKELCGAECETNTDCANKCVGTVFYSGAAACTDSCSCSYTAEDCASHNGWYDTEITQWVSAGQCSEKEQEQQEYREYSCSEIGCTYIVTEHQWIDTTNVRNKIDGTACDDSQSCTSSDVCAAGVCGGASIDCSANNLPPISTCTNDPDNNPKTLDTAAGFTSTCSGIDSCTQSSYEFTHTCNKELCGAECELNTDCASKCVGEVYYSAGSCNTESTCACSYTTEDCDTKDGWYDTETTQWASTGQCTEQEQLQQEYRDYSCAIDGCTYTITDHKWINIGEGRNKADSTSCDDSQSCTVSDVCTAGVCAGAPMDCSANNLQAITTCNNEPDNNPFTYDTRAGFTSECIDGTCTLGSQTITHACDKESCQAVCTLGETETQACGVSAVGECKMGIQTRSCTDGCAWGDWGTCEGAVNPSPEVCDNKDNNCNGQTDEGLTQPTSNQEGLCDGNTETCSAGDWIADDTNYIPSAEICDNTDNNCDGSVDESLTRPTTCGVGACSGNTGIETCSAGIWGGDTCNPLAGSGPEVCEGSIDDNCNGLVDEGCECTIGATRACGSDVGECKMGTQTCQNDGTWGTECIGALGPTQETCDNKDNNCDGSIDEDLTQACGEGVCSGISTCSAGVWGSCSTSASDAGICAKCDSEGNIIYDSTQNTDCSSSDLPGINTCTYDPDNNPLTLDTAAGFTSMCSGIGTCTQGSQTITHTCDKSQCQAECNLGETETQACGISNVGECKMGTQTRSCTDGCTWEAWSQCTGEIDPSIESCDNKDNNCNGQIDEGLAVQCGEGVCSGTSTCSAGVWGSCSTSASDAGVCAKCDSEGNVIYDPTQNTDCSAHSLPEVNSCSYTPDSNPLTLDTAPGFTSVCSGVGQCTEGSYTFAHTCNKELCGAECVGNADCANKCVGEVFYSGGACTNGCTCDYATEDCNTHDGWYDTDKIWVQANDCSDKELQLKEYRDFSCSQTGCSYTVTDTARPETGNTRNYENGIVCTLGSGEQGRCKAGVCGLPLLTSWSINYPVSRPNLIALPGKDMSSISYVSGNLNTYVESSRGFQTQGGLSLQVSYNTGKMDVFSLTWDSFGGQARLVVDSDTESIIEAQGTLLRNRVAIQNYPLRLVYHKDTKKADIYTADFTLMDMQSDLFCFTRNGLKVCFAV